MNTPFKWMIVFLLVAGLTGAFGCKKQEEKSGIVTLAVGSVSIQRPGSGPAGLQVKDLVARNDTVITGAMSLAVIQFSDNCVVQVQENSRFQVLSSGASDRDLYVKDGQVLAKLMRTGDNNATVRTPTAIAGVRGTQFSVNFREGTTRVAVSEGKVAVKASRSDESGKAISESKEETITAAGSTAEVTAAPKKAAGEEPALAVSVRPINENEKQALKKIEAVPVIEDPGRKTGEEIESAVKKAIGAAPAVEQDKIKQLMDKKTRTIDEIREAFSRVDEITLYNGRVIQGAILSRGTEYRILTPDGTITVPEEEIKSSGVIK
ncbi:MAG TPA: FecR family protein [Spirochaetota bacterium]|nr:FecR domain-containing protein [Spirochaetota bacterium]HPG52602.1 FecR family protein [Spirochaetota bacterium]HPN13141.1 FecR family protein [Spirochaetota bacterium]